MTKADQLAQALDDFLAVSDDVEAAAIVSADGLPMASALPPHVEEDRLAAMSAALLTLGERAAHGLGKGDLAQVFVEGVDGYVVLMSAGPNSVLVGVTSKAAKVGLVLFEMRRIAARVTSVMEDRVAPLQGEAAPATDAIRESVPAPAAELIEGAEPAPMRAPEPTPSVEAEPGSWERRENGPVSDWQQAPQPPAGSEWEPRRAETESPAGW